MTTLTLELPTDLVARLEQAANETGQPLGTLVRDTLEMRFAASDVGGMRAGRIRLRPVRLAAWPEDSTFRREDIYGDDAR